MRGLTKGHYQARQVETGSEMDAVLRLRQKCFLGREDAEDRDRFDDICQHFMVQDLRNRQVLCCFRVLPLGAGQIAQSYSAQFYDLGALEAFDGRLLELGRFCIDSCGMEADVLRMAWAMLTRYVDDTAIEMLFGCSSFKGTEPQAYAEVFDRLRLHHLAPAKWAPKCKAAKVYRYLDKAGGQVATREGLLRMPPLLRSYLMMGGWVSDHAVIDHALGTLHVFTGLEVAAIPAARQRLLRADAQ